MEIVIIEQNYTFVDSKIRHNWNIQLLGTGRIVGQIREVSADGHIELATFGDHPGGNRYRIFESMDKATDVALKWASRRFRS